MKFILFHLLAWVLAAQPALAQTRLSAEEIRPAGTEQTGRLILSAREATWLAAHRVIRVGIDPDYAPYEWIDKDGNYVGMAVDYLRRLEKPLGVRFEIVKDKSWAEALDMAKSGQLDLLTSAVKTPERSRYLTFTEPYRDTQTVIIDNGQGNFIGSLEYLAGKRVAVEQGYFMQELLEKKHPEIQRVLAGNTRDALQLVLDGHADAYVGDAGLANYAIKKNGLFTLRFSGQTAYSSQQGFAVTKNNAELAGILDKAMTTIPKEEADAILNRWLGLKIEQGMKRETRLRYSAALALSFLTFGYWIYRLRREIGYRQAAELRERSRSRILEMLASGEPLPEVLEAIVLSVERENSGMRCGILLLDSQGKHVGQVVAPSLADFYAAAIAGTETGTGPAALSGERVIVGDLASDPAWAPHRACAARAGLRACWSQPIHASSGHQLFGVFSVYHREVHWPTSAEISLVEQAARLASIAIEKDVAATKLRDSEAHYRELTEDVSDVIWKTDADLRITYINPVDERLRGYRSDEIIGHHVFEMFTAEGIATVTEIMRQRQQVEKDGTLTGPTTFEVQHRCKDGRLLWAEVLSKPVRDAHGAIIGYHGITRETTERKQMQDQVHELAFHDPLTKLPNRRLLSDRLGQAMAASKRSACHGAAMVLDLDNFKSLNDTQGHLVGDLLLIEVARRLTECVREIDSVARFGGDEFVVMLSNLNTEKTASKAQAGLVAEKIRTRLSEPYRLSVKHDDGTDLTVEHHCSASIGVVVFLGHESSADDVLKWADAALYQAKDAGRNSIRFYDAKA